jgi:peptidyl-prolyl cis-trans isomerase C
MNTAISPNDVPSTTASTGCGSQSCACASGNADANASLAPPAVASINGIALHEPGEVLDEQALRERAITELLCQEAVTLGLLPRSRSLTRTEPDEAQRGVIETMVDQAVTTPAPTEEESRRHYEAQKNRFIVGQALHVRHILFAVTPGVNVHALSQHAEKALLELSRKGVAEGRFVELASELSNCPSSTEGGDLGWLTPEDCAPELAKELFFQTDSSGSTERPAEAASGSANGPRNAWGGPARSGVHRRLMHSRYGLHIIEVLDRKKGTLQPYEAVREQIVGRLELQSRSTAMRHYLQLLVGQAKVEGVKMEGADTPLVQ